MASSTRRSTQRGTLAIELLGHSHLGDVPIAVTVTDNSGSPWKGAIRLGETQQVRVAPGEYTVQATLPSGQVMLRRASVAAGRQPSRITLDVAEGSPRETLAWAQLSRPDLLDSSEDDASSLESVWLRLWRNSGNGIWTVVPWPLQQATRYRGVVQYEFRLLGQSAQFYIQVGGADLPWRLVAVPADDVRIALKSRWATVPDGGRERRIDVEVGTLDTNAEVLFAYLRSGQVESAQEVSRSWQAAKLLEQKTKNPTLAAVAGYFLLKLQYLEDVHSIWAHNLADWIEWLPDGAVIDAVYLMRRDPPDFVAARARFIEATARGLPVFTRGMRLLYDNLATFDDDPDYRTPAVTAALKSVRRHCAAAEWESTTTAFVGTDPMVPGRIAVGRPESPDQVVFAVPNADDLAWLKSPDSSWIRTEYGWTEPRDAAGPSPSAAPLAVPGEALLTAAAPAASASAPPPSDALAEQAPTTAAPLASPAETERLRRVATGEEAAPEPASATPAAAEAPTATPSGAAVEQLMAQLGAAGNRADGLSKDTPERLQARLLRLVDEQTEAEQLAATRPVAVDVGSGAPAHLGGLAIERLVGTSDLVSTYFLERGLVAARAVCLVRVLADGRTRQATGFLVSPRLLLTVAHVIPTAADAATAYVEFDFQDGADGRLRQITRVACDATRFFLVDAELDVAIVALHEEAGRRFGWLRLIGNEGKTLIGEYLSSIGHPDGRPKQIALRELSTLDIGDPFLWCGGTSMERFAGSPLFNDQWEVVGMRHAASAVEGATPRGGGRAARSRSKADAADKPPHVIIEAVRTSRVVRLISRTCFTGEASVLIEEMLYAKPAVEAVSPPAPAVFE